MCSLSVVAAFFYTQAFAQEPEAPIVLESDVKVCEVHNVIVEGESSLKKDIGGRFSLQTNIPTREIVNVSHEIRQGEENIEIYKTSSFSHGFANSGRFLVKTLVNTRNGCTYVSQLFVEVYDRIFVYVGPGSDEFNFTKNSFQQDGTYLHEIIVGGESLQSQENMISLLLDDSYKIEYADGIIVDSQSLGIFLSAIPRALQSYGLKRDSAPVYVASTINQSAFRRLVATYSSLSNIKELGIVPENSIGSLINALLLDKDPKQLGLVKTFTVENGSRNNRQFMSKFVDVLLVNGMSLSFLLVLLLLPFLMLVITFFRQVVGFSTYGMYSPIILAFMFYLYGWQPLLSLLTVTFVTVYVVGLITGKLHLLSSSKSSLKVGIYAMLLIVLLIIETNYNLELLGLLKIDSIEAMFPLLFVLVIGSNIFRDGRVLLKKSWWMRTIQLAIVVFCLLYLIREPSVHNIVLGYPELSLVAIILILLVGRFTGLQVTEYFRFLPLILKSVNDEEE